jgi:hypothetical protein
MTVRPSTLRLISQAMVVMAMAVMTTILMAMAAALAGCGDPKAQTPPITLTFSSNYPLPTTLNTGSTTGIAVLVANDPKNGGVNFTCTPDTSAGECGAFSSPPSAGNNIPVCYQAPSAVPSGGMVTLVATSASDPAISISSTPIAIASGSSVSGCP